MNFLKKIYIFWKLKDGLYYWKYNKDEYKISIGGRNDRGCNEYQDVVFIDNSWIQEELALNEINKIHPS